MAVAIAAGRNGVDTLLVASQVALSIVLPFIVFPLLYLTSSKSIMSVKKPLPTPVRGSPELQANQNENDASPVSDAASVRSDSTKSSEVRHDVEGAVETVDYSNHKIVAALGWLLWLVVVAANVYAIVTLGLGET